MQRKWQVLSVVGVGVVVVSLDLFIVNFAFPDLRREFAGASLGEVSWVLNAYAIVIAALLVPAGRWADAVGRKRVFLAGFGLFTGASALCAVAPSLEALVAARVLQATGGALLIPTSLGLLLPEFPARERPIAVGAWAASGGVAAALGPPLGGLLVEASWRWVFVVNVPVGLAALGFGARVLREVRDPTGLRPDLVGAAGITGGIGALVVAIVEGSDWSWAGARVLGLFALSLLLLAGVAARSRTHPAPIIEPALVRVRAFSVACVGSLVFFVGFGAMLLAGVLFLTGVWEKSVLAAGLMLAPGPATAAAFSVPGARLSGRHGQRLVGSLGAALFALGALWWLVTLQDAQHWATAFLPGMLLTGAGVGLVNPSLTGAAAAALPSARFATGAAVLTMGRQVGSALGVAILVAVLGTPESAADFDAAWIVVLLSGVGASAALAALGPIMLAGSEPVTVTPVAA